MSQRSIEKSSLLQNTVYIARSIGNESAMKLCAIIMSLIFAPCAAAQEAPSDVLEDIYSNYIEHITNASLPSEKGKSDGNNADLKEYQTKLDSDVLKKMRFPPEKEQPIKNFFLVESPQVQIAATDYRVSGAYPPCGPGTPTVGQDVLQIQKALGAVGAATDSYLATGFLFTGMAAFINNAIKVGNEYQKDARCANVCALVPSNLQEKDLEVEGQIIPLNGAPAKRQTIMFSKSRGGGAPGDDVERVELLHGYTLLQAPHLDESILRVPARPNSIINRELADKDICPMKALCSTVKHWTHGYAAAAKLSVKFDATRDMLVSQCTDFTMVNLIYRAYTYKIMNLDKARNYYEEKLNEVTKTPTKDPRLMK
jgi:hypothetical protein